MAGASADQIFAAAVGETDGHHRGPEVVQAHRATERRSRVVQLGAAHARGEEVGAELVGRLVSIDDLPCRVDEHEVIVVGLRGELAPCPEGPHEVRVDGDGPRAPRLLPIEMDDAVTKIEAPPGECGDLVERLRGVLDGGLDLLDLSPQGFLTTPPCAIEEAVKHAAAEIDVDAAEERSVLVGVDVLERDFGPNLRHRVRRDRIVRHELRRVLRELHHPPHHLGNVAARG